jgi:hypothetical protein
MDHDRTLIERLTDAIGNDRRVGRWQALAGAIRIENPQANSFDSPQIADRADVIFSR